MNPATAMLFNLLITGIGGATAAIAGTSSTGSSAAIWAGLIGTIVGGFNTALHAYSPPVSGPLAK